MSFFPYAFAKIEGEMERTGIARIDEDMDRCANLCWKGMYIASEWDPTIQHCNDRAFWCQKTAQPLGRTAKPSMSTTATKHAAAIYLIERRRDRLRTRSEPTLMMMKTLVTFAVGSSLALAASLPKANLQGTYVEARNADVYTGPCYANSEVNMLGNLAVMAGEWIAARSRASICRAWAWWAQSRRARRWAT